MAAGMTQLLICQRALADIGTRSTITSVNPTDGSQESFYCNLYYNGVRDHLLRAANWNFAKRTVPPALWKALPGTPENPTPAATTQWLLQYPAPPYLYAYVYPDDCIRMRQVMGPLQQVPLAPPIFSGVTGVPNNYGKLPAAKFEVGADAFDANGNSVSNEYGVGTLGVVAYNPGSGYQAGETFTINGNLGGGVPVVSPLFMISGVTSVGSVWSIVTKQAGTWTVAPTAGTIFTPLNYSGTGGGLQIQLTMVKLALEVKVVLTNMGNPLFEYTTNAVDETGWDQDFDETFVSALAGRLAPALTGDKALARDKLTIANAMILNARVNDGNEGLTVDDHMPDWLIARGAGGGLGYETFFYPLGPLFPLSPLI